MQGFMTFQPGDRVEINGEHGKVAQVSNGLVYVVLDEPDRVIGQWVSERTLSHERY